MILYLSIEKYHEQTTLIRNSVYNGSKQIDEGGECFDQATRIGYPEGNGIHCREGCPHSKRTGNHSGRNGPPAKGLSTHCLGLRTRRTSPPRRTDYRASKNFGGHNGRNSWT